MLKSADCTDKRLAKELTLAGPVGWGKSAAARKVQEYLWVNGVKPVIDGDWGNGTQTALEKFCADNGLPNVTQVDQQLMDLLAQPLLRAVRPFQSQATLGQTVVHYARQHLAEHPVEIGGPNSGPWVRLYMSGNEGKAWLWCAGFATSIALEAARVCGVKTKVKRTFSCDVLAMTAKAAGTYKAKGTIGVVPPGSIFLVRSASSSSDWIHTGLVLEQHGSAITTGEGNTDHGGSSNGYEATERIRNLAKVDIVLL